MSERFDVKRRAASEPLPKINQDPRVCCIVFLVCARPWGLSGLGCAGACLCGAAVLCHAAGPRSCPRSWRRSSGPLCRGGEAGVRAGAGAARCRKARVTRAAGAPALPVGVADSSPVHVVDSLAVVVVRCFRRRHLDSSSPSCYHCVVLRFQKSRYHGVAGAQVRKLTRRFKV